jgi:SAM-dependent methyltransferase
VTAPVRASWLDHPAIAAHYRDRSRVQGVRWERWVASALGGAPAASLELRCGTGDQSLFVYEQGWARRVDGLDADEDRIDTAETRRRSVGAPGAFRVGDVNAVALDRDAYDLVFACHGFHHFFALEHVLDQVHTTLKPRGIFVIEGYVGPTRFQWTSTQIALVRILLSMMPERLRTFPWGAVKTQEGRPNRSDLAAAAGFEAIRSAEILPLVAQRFDVLVTQPIGGTLQHLLYNGIMHNFGDDDAEARRHLDGIMQLEDVLVDDGLLPSDFVVLIAHRR